MHRVPRSQRFTQAAQRPERAPRPAQNEPGTLAEQIEIISVWGSDPTRHHDSDGAWEGARRLILDHARQGAT